MGSRGSWDGLTLALDPELLKRRQRITLPRAPLITLGEKVGVKEADKTLEDLLKELLYYAERETLFTMTLEKMRLFSALQYAGFMAPLFYNCEIQAGPGATVTTYLPIPPGFVLTSLRHTFYNSLPWWATVSIWWDTDLPALPVLTLVRAPDYYDHVSGGIGANRLFFRFTVTNNHATDTLNFLAVNLFMVMPEATWTMLEKLYLAPIAEYAQKKAEEVSGRPWP